MPLQEALRLQSIYHFYERMVVTLTSTRTDHVKFGMTLKILAEKWQAVWLLLQKFQLFQHYRIKQSSIFNVKSRNFKLRHEIPEDLIINFDQTPLLHVCTGKRTYHTQDASNAPLVGKGKKANYSTFTITKSGQFLLMQLIYQGTAKV